MEQEGVLDVQRSRADPGATLQAGTYMFQLADPDSARHVVMVSSKEGDNNDDVRNAVGKDGFLRAGDHDALSGALLSIRPEGRTALYDALLAGLDRLDQGARARKALVLISDGGDNASAAKLDVVLQRARKSNAAIYTIGLFDADDPDRNPGALKSLARDTGGERFLPRSAGPLMTACQHIARDIRAGYTIGYAPPDRDGHF